LRPLREFSRDPRRRATHRDVMETGDGKRPDEFSASGSTK
jgi:hypothetical protein